MLKQRSKLREELTLKELNISLAEHSLFHRSLFRVEPMTSVSLSHRLI